MPLAWFSVAAFAGSFGSYLLLAGSLSWTECIAGAAAAFVTAVFAVAQHSAPDVQLSLGLPPLRVLLRTCAGFGIDTLRVGAALARAILARQDGNAGWQAFRPGGRSPAEAGRRALVTLLTSVAPNGFVLDIRPSALPEADDALLVHRLVPAPPSGDAEWPA